MEISERSASPVTTITSFSVTSNIHFSSSSSSKTTCAKMSSSPSVNNTPSPRFMSPTVSSSNNKTVHSNPDSSRNQTFTPATKVGKGRIWVSSAAKKVGIGRSSSCDENIKHAEKAMTPKNAVRVVNLPDKLTIASSVNKKTGPSCPLPANKILAVEKPLPSPPILQDAHTMDMTRHLLDATEKPLRRSPPGKPVDMEEDWPALSPQKLRPAPSKASTVPNEHEVAEGTVSGLPRFPARVFSDPTTATPKLINIKRKSTSKPSEERPGPQITEPGETSIPHIITKNIPVLGTSPGAAHEKESADKSRNQALALPRQTKTSSLRARISAGSLSNDNKDGKNFTGSTNITTPNKSVQLPSEIVYKPAGRVSSGPSGPSHRVISRPDGRLQGHLPAKVIAGSRRSGLHRPMSRTGARVAPSNSSTSAGNDQVGEEVGGHGSHAVQPETKNSAIKDITHLPITGSTLGPRSSLPIRLKKSIPVTTSQLDGSKRIEGHSELASKEPLFNGNAFDIFEDGQSNRLGDEVTHTKHQEGEKREIVSHIKGGRVKRLSKTFPEDGPILTIAADADAIIMGDVEINKENEHPTKPAKKNKNLHRLVVTKELRKATNPTRVDASTVSKKGARDRSIDGHSSTPLADGVNFRNHKEKARNTNGKAMVLDDADSDPFVDAVNKPTKANAAAHQVKPTIIGSKSKSPALQVSHKELHHNKQSVDVTSRTVTSGTVNVEKACIENAECGRDGGFSKKSTLPDRFPSSTIQEFLAVRRVSPTSERTISPGKPANPVSPTRLSTSPLDATKRVDPSSKPASERSGVTKGTAKLTTPPKQILAEDIPPRSSSRSAPSTIIASPPLVETPKLKVTKGAFSEEFADVQKKLAAASKIPTPTAMKTGASAPRPADTSAKSDAHIYKRESNATKHFSQGSGSKHVLSMSHIRGLFRKTPSDGSKKDRSSTGSVTIAGPPYETLRSAGAVKHSRTAKLKSFGSAHSFTANGTQTSISASPMSVAQDAVAETTSLTMQILNSARHEVDSPTKERYLEMGKVMVEAITNARDAEKAMEQAKVAADRAEMACVMTRKSLLDAARLVGEWNNHS